MRSCSWNSSKNLKLYVYDDGIGFDTAKLNDRNEDITSGFGLVSMRERVDCLAVI